MRCVVGIDLGSTTTKAVMLDEEGVVVGRGITNSRSNYEVACAVARDEAHTAARFAFVERAAQALDGPGAELARQKLDELHGAFRLELFLAELEALRVTMHASLSRSFVHRDRRAELAPAIGAIVDGIRERAPADFLPGAARKSDFFRDLAGAAFVAGAEARAREGGPPFEQLVGVFDRAILDVETRRLSRDIPDLLRRASARVWQRDEGAGLPLRRALDRVVESASAETLEEIVFVGTGYGRQTLPFPKEAVRSEILCHGRGAHRVCPGTRTVLDIGGQDTKAIQVDAGGVVTSFQMNDRCAAGCGRYLGYIADELSLGLHELGPLALQSTRTVKVCSTCTVFASAELRERLALGQKREDILAGLHRAIMVRAMSLLARSGGVFDEFTFTGGVCNNPMAVKVLRELVAENYGAGVTINTDPNSIYMGALGAALFALDDLRAGVNLVTPAFAREAS